MHAAASGGIEIEAVEGLRPEVDTAIAAALSSCITETALGIGKQYVVSNKTYICEYVFTHAGVLSGFSLGTVAER